MSTPKPKGGLDAALRVVIVVFLAFVGFIFTFGSLFILIFVPVMTWIIWTDRGRIVDLERRLAALEGHPADKKEEQ